MVSGFARARSPEVVWSLLFFAGWLLILCRRWLLLLLLTFYRLVELFPLAGAFGTAAITGVSWFLLFSSLYGRFLSSATPEKGEERNKGNQQLLDSPELLFPSPGYSPLLERERREERGEKARGERESSVERKGGRDGR